MNADSYVSRTVIAMLLAVLCFPAIAICADTESVLRIGTYDSRFVALAFYRMDNMKYIEEFMNGLALERADALESKDEQRVKEIEAQGPAMQNLMHQQVFGNLSIPNVMASIDDRLSAIAQEANVSLILSKWDIQYRETGIETVDVTQQLLALFDMDDTTRKMIDNGIQSGQEPVSVEQLLNPYE